MTKVARLTRQIADLEHLRDKEIARWAQIEAELRQQLAHAQQEAK